MLKEDKKGIFIVLSAPSGVGKTTVAGMVMQRDRAVHRSVSLTTRKPRSGEKDGEDYYFVSEAVFRQRCAKGELLEYAEVFNNLYGTSMDNVKRIMDAGLDVMCTIDWQGGMQIREKLDCVRIFLLPPSLSELKRRLIRRSKNDVGVVKGRIQKAKEEISKSFSYDYVVVNDDIDRCVEDILSIIRVERINVMSRSGLLKHKIHRLSVEDLDLSGL